jgi:hypothetical protein
MSLKFWKCCWCENSHDKLNRSKSFCERGPFSNFYLWERWLAILRTTTIALAHKFTTCQLAGTGWNLICIIKLFLGATVGSRAEGKCEWLTRASARPHSLTLLQCAAALDKAAERTGTLITGGRSAHGSQFSTFPFWNCISKHTERAQPACICAFAPQGRRAE